MTITDPKKPAAKETPKTPAAGDNPPADKPPGAGATPTPPADEPLGQPAMDFINRSLGRTERKKKETPPAKPDDQPPGAPPAAPAPAKPAARKPAPKPVAPPAPALDEDKLAAAITKGLTAANKKPEDDKKDEPLSDDDARRVAVYKQMESQFGERYKGLSERYVGNLKKLKDYADKWKLEHPDEEFDEDSDEHRDTVDRLNAEIDYEDDHYNVALVKVTTAETEPDDKTKAQAQRLERLERQERMREEAPKIVQLRDKSGDRFWQKLGEEFKTVLDENGSLDPAALAALKESDPDVYETVVGNAKVAESYAMEIYMLDNDLVQFVGNLEINKHTPADLVEKIKAHRHISEFAYEQEQKILARTLDKQMDSEGRTFLPRTEYNKLPANQRDNHWTFSHEDISFLKATQVAKETRKLLQAEEEKFMRRAKAKGVALPESSSTVKSNRPAATRPIEDDDEEKPDSPTSPTTPVVAPRGGAKGGAASGGLEGWVSRALGKS